MFVTRGKNVVGRFCILKMRNRTDSIPKESYSLRENDNLEMYLLRLAREMEIWNILIQARSAKKGRLPKVFIVDKLCGYGLLVMLYLFPLMGMVDHEYVVKDTGDYVSNYETQIKAQLQAMWQEGFKHGDLLLRHVGLWKGDDGKHVVQLFDFGNAVPVESTDDMDNYIEKELKKLKEEFKVERREGDRGVPSLKGDLGQI